MRDQSQAILEQFVAGMGATPEVAALFNLAGATDYLLHAMVRDTDHLRGFILENSWELPCYVDAT